RARTGRTAPGRGWPSRWLPAASRSPSLPALRIEEFGCILCRFPPVTMALVPLDRGSQAVLEVCVPRLPTQFLAQLARIDCVPQIVAGTIRHMVVGRGGSVHQCEDQADHHTVEPFADRSVLLALA